MIYTIYGDELCPELMNNYFDSLVDMFFKILPLREEEEPTLAVYIRVLQAELIGCVSLIDGLNDDARFMSLISILQYLIDNPACPVGEVKREVFNAIGICNKLRRSYITDVETAQPDKDVRPDTSEVSNERMG